MGKMSVLPLQLLAPSPAGTLARQARSRSGLLGNSPVFSPGEAPSAFPSPRPPSPPRRPHFFLLMMTALLLHLAEPWWEEGQKMGMLPPASELNSSDSLFGKEVGNLPYYYLQQHGV